jgi:hypothetical protein
MNSATPNIAATVGQDFGVEILSIVVFFWRTTPGSRNYRQIRVRRIRPGKSLAGAVAIDA